MELRTEFAVKLSLASVGFFVNLLTILAHVIDPLRLFRNLSSMFVLNITVLDCGFSVIWLICYALYLAECSEFTQSDYVVLLLTLAIRLATMTAIAYFSLALELYLSISRPLWHRVKMTHKVCRSWIVATWVLHLTFHEVTIRFLIPARYETFFYGCYAMIFFFAIQSLNLATFLSLRKQSRSLGERSDVDESTSRALKRRQDNEKRFFVTVAISSIIQTVSFVPFIVFASLLAFMHVLGNIDFQVLLWLEFVSHCMIFFHAIVKPFFYLWRLPKYGKTLKQLWCEYLG